jgi:hypothetical protein
MNFTSNIGLNPEDVKSGVLPTVLRDFRVPKWPSSRDEAAYGTIDLVRVAAASASQSFWLHGQGWPEPSEPRIGDVDHCAANAPCPRA